MSNETRECCGNCKNRYLYAENGSKVFEVVCRCNADYILMPDGGHRMTNKRVRWYDSACNLFEQRQETAEEDIDIE